jgi:hypothetical protein
MINTRSRIVTGEIRTNKSGLFWNGLAYGLAHSCLPF